jgi:hypothetical protein
MKKFKPLFHTLMCLLIVACADNTLDEKPHDQNFPLRLILDAGEGSDLADAEDYDIEIAFADHTGKLPSQPIELSYRIDDLEGDMEGIVAIDKVIYEVEIDDCTFERELEFVPAADGLSGTISIAPDPDLGTVPESFEVVIVLPGEEDTGGSFTFELTGLQSSDHVILGTPEKFEYEVLENDLAGEWELEIENEEAFEAFKEVFGPLNDDIQKLTFEEITGKIVAKFEFEEMKFIVELAEEEEVTVCENGDMETETENKVIEFEAEYESEDGKLAIEGSHFILEDDGEVKDELDFVIESDYLLEDEETFSLRFLKAIDEDHFADGEELFAKDDGQVFTFKKD